MASTLTLSEFLGEFPEFADSDDWLVQSRLNQAHRAFSEEVFGARYLDAVRYKTADLLASSPLARNLRLDKGDGASVYREALADILVSVPATGVVVDLSE